MESYVLKSITLEQAQEKQFQLVDKITKNFKNNEILELGQVGIFKDGLQPKHTSLTENTIADFFNFPHAKLVRNAGTGAIYYALRYCLQENKNILVHNAPVYPTTLSSLQDLQANIFEADFHNLASVCKTIEENNIKTVLLQITRQKITDYYSAKDFIKHIKENFKDINIITDDNYAVMKVEKIGVELGADVSCFSLFKLLGKEGIGCIVCKKELYDFITRANYSGGSKVQGHEALECLRGLVYAPVALAIQAKEVENLVNTINSTKIKGLKKAFVANAQSKVAIIELESPIASKVVENAVLFGAVSYPVGAESKYEIAPMVYNVSGTFQKDNPKMKDYFIRVNPMRASAFTVVNILNKTMDYIS